MEWTAPAAFEDIRYETAEGIARITICRPEVRNAFRPATLFELSRAFDMARDDPEVGVVVLTGEGPDAFCSGGDQRIRGDDGYKDARGIGRLNVLDLQVQIRRLPKPVIAMVAGYAIGGGPPGAEVGAGGGTHCHGHCGDRQGARPRPLPPEGHGPRPLEPHRAHGLRGKREKSGGRFSR